MGVTLKMGSDYGLDMTDYDLDLSSIGDVSVSSYNKTTISGYVDGVKVVIKGQAFTSNDYGPTGGTLNGFTETMNGSLLASVSGLKISVKSLVNLVENGSEASVHSFVKTVFSGADSVSGGNQADVLLGFAGNDTLTGNRGDDTLFGGTGNDKLIGGIGADQLYGEGGKDTFIYKTVTDSNERLGVDTLHDFSGTGGDRIDLSGIDANTTTAKNDAFAFIGDKAFSGKAGELRFEKSGTETYVTADTNGDKVADFTLHFDDAITFTTGFFLL